MNRNTIVVAVDGTERSIGALRYAAQAARTTSRPLVVLHVAPGYLPISPLLPLAQVEVEPTGRAVLAEAIRFVREDSPGIEVTTDFSVGPRIIDIVERSEGAGVLVLGRETRTGLDRILTGTTVAAVSARAHCPVAVVPSTWEPGPATGVVVAGVDAVEDLDDLLSPALAVAAERHASLILLHSWEIPDPYRDLIEERTQADAWTSDAQGRIEAAVAEDRAAHPDRYAGVPVEVRIAHDQPARALVHASAAADAIVVLRHRRRVLPGPHLGSTVRAVLHHAAGVVEVVPASVVAESGALVLEDSCALLR